MPTLLDLVRDAGVKLKPQGHKWWAPCPFHDDKTASFKVEEYSGKQRYHCFGCGARGDKYDWVMTTQHVDFREAQRILGTLAKPSPDVLAARKQREDRAGKLKQYRDKMPDCTLPDWAIET